jgi:hypothetical protein
MKLPTQAAPVTRTPATTMFVAHLAASDKDTAACKIACNRLPEPARSMCKSQCDWPN